MADYTAITNLTLEQCISPAYGNMVNGENLTIKSGAIVTCDQTPSILLGNIDIENGKLLVDGINISAGNMINFVGEDDHRIAVEGRGTFEVTGAWVDVGTTNGTASQVIDISSGGFDYWNSTLEDAIPMIQIETGRRINFDTVGAGSVTPEVDDFVRKTSNKSVLGRIVEVQSTYLVVRYLTGTLADDDDIQIRKVIDNEGPDLQVSWTAKVNSGTTPADIKEAGVYQEFGNCVVNGTSQIADFHGGVGGFVFEHIWLGTSFKLGSAAAVGSVGSFIPPTSCNIRIPNVHFSTSDITSFAAGNTNWSAGGTSYTDRYNLLTTEAGSISFSVCNLGSVWFGTAYAYEYSGEYVGANISFGCENAGSKVTYNHCVAVQDIMGLSYLSPYGFNCENNASGADIIDCMVICGRCRISLEMISVVDVTMTGCIITNPSVAAASASVRDYIFTRCRNITFNNNIVISGDSVSKREVLYVNGCVGFDCNMFLVSGSQDETPCSASSYFMNFNSSSEINFYGLEFLGNGIPKTYISVLNSTDMKFRAIGMIDDKLDYGTTGSNLISLLLSTRDVDIARCWKTNGSSEEIVVISATVKNVNVTNCSGKYASEFQPSGQDDILVRGLHGGSGTPGGTTGIETDYLACYGRQIHDGFSSDTAGYIAALCISPSSSLDNTTVRWGSPTFNRAGGLHMVSGDIIEIEMDYFARGHIEFPGTYTSGLGASAWNANEWANVTVEFQYDDGSGWNGTETTGWLNARTPTNWTGITIVAATGIKLKFKYTATGTQDIMSTFIVDTVTSLAYQKANFYPIDQVQCDVTLAGIVENSNYYIYDADSSVKLFDGEAGATDVVKTCVVPSGTNLIIKVRKASGDPKYLTFETTAITNTTSINVAIIQTKDNTA